MRPENGKQIKKYPACHVKLKAWEWNVNVQLIWHTIYFGQSNWSCHLYGIYYVAYNVLSTVLNLILTIKSVAAKLLSRFSCVWLCATPQTAAHQAPLSMGFSRQEYWSELPLPSPECYMKLKNSQPLRLTSFTLHNAFDICLCWCIITIVE